MIRTERSNLQAPVAIARLLIAAALVLPAVGCGQTSLNAPGVLGLERDWSGVAAKAAHSHPHRQPARDQAESGSHSRKYLCNAATEEKLPEAFVLSVQSAAFRKVEQTHADSQRQELARRLSGDRDVMAAFDNWGHQTDATRLDVFKRIAAIEGQVMGFTVPPMSPKSGVPKDGTLAYFDSGNGQGIGEVVLYPKAIGKGDKWSAIATVTHEMRHAYQWQLETRGAHHQLTAGSQDETLALGFSQADKVIDAVGGEDNLSYGDYSHLCNEYDAFATGNMVAKLLSHGQADTTALGFIDVQFTANGTAPASLATLEARSGAAGLLDAVNAAEQAEDKRTGFVPG